MIRHLDLSLGLIVLTIGGALLLSWVTLVAAVVRVRKRPRAPREWVKRLYRGIGFAWLLGIAFVLGNVGVLSRSDLWYEAPLGHAKLTAKSPAQSIVVDAHYEWNDVHLAAGLHMEWAAAFSTERDGKQISKRFERAVLPMGTAALSRQEIAAAYQTLGFDTSDPTTTIQINQLTTFFARLSDQGLTTEGMSAFDCVVPDPMPPYATDSRAPKGHVIAWLAAWTVALALGLRWASRPPGPRTDTELEFPQTAGALPH